ncbi:MAG: IPT/TIG domain-containing protein, partial [Acidobacteriota bacterium]
MADYRTNFVKHVLRLWLALALSVLILPPAAAQDVDSDGQWTLSDVATTLRMAGGRETASPLADLDNDGLVTVRDVALALRRVDGRDDQAILPDQDGLITAPDGAQVYFPPYFSPERIEATLTKLAEPQDGVVDERVEVSGEYQLEISGTAPSGGDYWVTVPLDRSRFPTNKEPAEIIDGLVAEVFDPQTGTWHPAGDFSWFDETSGQFTFNVAWLDSAAGSPAVEIDPEEESGKFRLSNTYQSRWKVKARMFSSRYAAGRQGSNFKLYFYMPDAGHADATMSDTEWNSTTGNAGHPDIPDFIEDLDAALNSAYSELLTLRHNQGGALFDAQSTPMSVCVQDLGGASGTTKIGGDLFCDLFISNRKDEIGSWNRMLGVAAHEIVHVLQGKYFSRYTKAQWLVESSANYYAARGAKFSQAERLTLYGGFTFLDASGYLSLPITSGAQESAYALAHFLDWLSARYSRDIVADTFVQGKTSHLLDLGAAIQQAGGLGLTSSFGDYVTEIVTEPQGSLKANSDIRRRMETASVNFLSSPKPRLEYSSQLKQTYIAFKKSLKPLSTALIRILGRDNRPGLLVVDASGSQDFELEWLAYPFQQAEVPDFNQTALSSGMSFSAFRSQRLAVDDFGWTTSKNGIEVFLANSGTTSNVFAHLAFYLLLAPEILDRSSDSVAWSTSLAGNIPDSYIRGYNVYRNGSRVNGSGPIPHAPETSLIQAIPNLASQDDIVVTVVDRFGNEWPAVVPQTPLNVTSVNPRQGTVGTSVTINGNGFGADRNNSNVTFGGTSATEYPFWSETQIMVKVPNGAKTGPLILNIGGKTADAGTFTVQTHTVAGYFPHEEYPGEEVWIGGTGFGENRGSSQVTFGGVPADSYISWSDTDIQVRVPAAGSSGDLVVSVAGIDVTAGPFTVLQPPQTITDFTPFEGRIGDEVTITGTGFGTWGLVSFNGIYASCPTWTDTQIICTVPSGAQTGDLVVEVDDVPVVAGTFYVLAGFEVTSVNPPEAHIGDEVTITGTGFGTDCGNANCYLMLGDLKIDFFWSWQPTQIRFQVPIEAISGSLWLYSQGVGSDLGRYTIRPRIYTNPEDKILWPRSLVRIDGNGFGEQRPSSAITFDGETAQVYEQWTPSTVEAYVPDSVLGKDQVTVGLDVGGLTEEVGDI